MQNRVSGAPSPRIKRRARVITRTHKSLGCSLTMTQEKQACTRQIVRSQSIGRSLTPRAKDNIRVITRRTLNTQALEDIPSKNFSTLLLARALKKLRE